jgi:hypothetical protein
MSANLIGTTVARCPSQARAGARHTSRESTVGAAWSTEQPADHEEPGGPPIQAAACRAGDVTAGMKAGSDTTSGSATTASTRWCSGVAPLMPSASLGIVPTIPGRQRPLIAAES